MSKHTIDEELDYVLAQYDWQDVPQLIPGPSGMNNTTVAIQDGNEKAIIRIYNNHADPGKLQFEHAMLSGLQQAALPIATPVPILNKQHTTITTTPEGKLAAAFQYINGERPSADHMEMMTSLAQAAAVLSQAFASLSIEGQPAYTPYYELESNYPPFLEEHISELLAYKQLADYESELRLIQHERIELERLKQALQQLPQQWIHGDINCSNSLAIGNKVVAILDFEFVTRDLRAMELAVLLSEIINPTTAQLEQQLNAMLQAYMEIIPFTEDELALLPALIKLRSVDVVMHFVERLKQRLDAPDVLRQIVAHAQYVIRCMNEIKLYKLN